MSEVSVLVGDGEVGDHMFTVLLDSYVFHHLPHLIVEGQRVVMRIHLGKIQVQYSKPSNFTFYSFYREHSFFPSFHTNVLLLIATILGHSYSKIDRQTDRLAEHLVHSQITKYIEENNLYNAHQGGFRKGSSNIDTIADFTDEVLLDTNEGLVTVVLFVDMRKAFDTVDHSILLQKISRLGLHPETASWLANYLSERLHKTYANGQLSSAANITCGVLQGLILGPMLYLIYVNDISSIVKHCSMQLYADDTVIYASADSPYIALKIVQNKLDKFTVWCHENKLSINTTA